MGLYEASNQIAAMKNGRVAECFVVHHKVSLLRGGGNDFNNLTVLEADFHRTENKMLHYYEEGNNLYGF